VGKNPIIVIRGAEGVKKASLLEASVGPPMCRTLSMGDMAQSVPDAQP
jgi:hypothetical protein